MLMKKIFTIVLLTTLFSSCYEVSTYQAPDKTRYAYLLFQYLNESVGINAQTLDMLLYIDKWIAEDDPEVKYYINKLYFEDYGINMDEDIVSLTALYSSNYGYNKIDIDTKGLSIWEQGARWSITIEDWKMQLDVECTSAQQSWLMTTDYFNYNCAETSLELTLYSDTAVGFEYYSIIGYGSCSAYDKAIEYKIDEPVKIYSNLEIVDDYMSFNNTYIYDGVITYAPESLEDNDNARVEIESINSYTIYYRTFENSYMRYYTLYY